MCDTAFQAVLSPGRFRRHTIVIRLLDVRSQNDSGHLNLLDSSRGRRALFAALYASEGAPIGYIWWALPTKLTDAGVEVSRVTQITALATLIWALKFLWAPVIDAWRGPRWGYRSWIVSAQTGMGLVLLPLLALPIAEHVGVAGVLLLVHAFFAATQDASIDALCVSRVPQSERGAVNAWMQVGMLTSRSVFGGGALLFEQYFGERAVLIGLLGCIWFSMALVVFLTRDRTPLESEQSPKFAGRASWTSFAHTLRRALSHRRTWLGLGFACVGGAGFEGVGAVTGPLLRSVGADTKQVGLFLGLAAVGAMAVGSILGGWRGDRVGRARTALESTVGIVVVIVLLATALGYVTDPVGLCFALLAALYLLIGVFTASSYALFMDLTDPRLGATQFSAFMGATNLCESWSSATVGGLAMSTGFGQAILVPAGLSLFGLPILLALRGFDSRPGTSESEAD